MNGSSIGTMFRATFSGESHGKAFVAIIDGCPAGMILSLDDIISELKRDVPDAELGTKRRDSNIPEIITGMFNGATLGTPLTIMILNDNPKIKDYSLTVDHYRPGHAEFSYHQKYGIYHPFGGGRASGRECIMRLAVGAVAKIILAYYSYEISFHSRVVELGGLPIHDNTSYEKAKEHCLAIYKEKKDSTGGVVELVIKNVPAGIGEPIFGKLNAVLMGALASIGGVKCVEIGCGNKTSSMTGSEMNDPFAIIHGKIKNTKNDAGGTLGGISTGEDLIFRLHVKATPTLSISQRTVNWKEMRETEISMSGRHDINFTPRICPIAEAMAAISLVDQMMISGLINRCQIPEGSQR